MSEPFTPPRTSIETPPPSPGPLDTPPPSPTFFEVQSTPEPPSPPSTPVPMSPQTPVAQVLATPVAPPALNPPNANGGVVHGTPGQVHHAFDVAQGPMPPMPWFGLGPPHTPGAMPVLPQAAELNDDSDEQPPSVRRRLNL
jgi:hypothetical protein